ncbi:AsmA family protein [Ectothiorhodospiraceae bacterium WFHF3C12]|nr:AsmA family protein [Ectothiorhodospiraceae bacterium WFHF3C12]
MRVLKRLLLGVAIVLVLLAAGLAVLVWTFDANAYRAEIAAAVEQRTGREFALDGELSLTIYPWLGLAMEQARLGNAPGFGDAPMARVERVHLAARLWPLLSGDVELGRVTLRGLRLRLARAADGTTNWQDLAFAPAQPRVVAVAQPAEGAGAPAWLRQARLAGLEVIDAEVIWSDLRSGQELALEAMDLTAEDIRLGRSVPLETDGNVKLPGEMTAGFDLSTRVQVDEALARATADDIELIAEVSGPGIPAGRQRATVTGALSADLAAKRVDVTPLTLTWGPVEATGEMAVDAGGAAPTVRGRLDLAQFDPGEVFETLEMALPETGDPQALESARGELRFAFADGRLAVPELKLVLDQSTLTGNAMVAAFAPPDVRFDLSLDAIDADRYLPPGSEEETAPTPGQAAAGAGGNALEPLRNLRLDGRFAAGSITAGGTELTEVNAQVKAENGVMRVHPLRAKVYGGQYEGDVTVDARGDEPTFKLNEKLSRIDAEPLVQQFAGKDLLRGLGSLSLDVTASGTGLDAWLGSATGRADFRFENGAVKGMNLAQQLRGAVQRLEGESAPEVEVRETDFTELTGSMRIEDGVVRNDDLAASSPLLRVNGEGKANLRDRTVNYLLTVNVVNTLTGQGGDPLDKLRRIPVPVRIKGPLLEPDITLDLQAALTARQREKVEKKQEAIKQDVQEERDRAREELQEKRDEAKQKAQEKLEKKLEGLLNR